MKTLKIKINEYANRDLRPTLGVAAVIFKQNTGVNLEFDVEKKEYTKPNWYEDRPGVFYIAKGWLEKHILDEEYDICVGAFNDNQWRQDFDNSIGGTAEASPINDTGIIYMTATEGQMKTLKKGGKEYSEFLQRLLHEICHVAYDDLMKRPDLDRTHYWDYERENLFGALRGIDLSNYTTKAEKKRSLQLTVIKLAKKVIELLLQKAVGAGKNPAVTPIQPRTTLERWAEAIKEFEGWYPGSRSYRQNNPGNLRWSKYQSGTKNNFSVFPDYETGWKALLFQLRIATDGRSSVYTPNDTLLQFFSTYAPSTDNNYPEKYAKFVADKLGVSIDTKISDLGTS